MEKLKKEAKLIAFGWLIAVISLFFYSFTQIDLGLTLTRISFWQVMQKNFQLIGYFNRPLSTALYLGILFLLFLFYFSFLLGVKKKWFTARQIWFLILLTAGVLWFSYNAFSYDLFNYIFDAKIVVFYRQSPYDVKPLDFLGDPMLGFMHWTHRPSVYPPFWIGLSIIPFILGFGKLIPQILAFKAVMAGSYLGTVWLVWKISELISPKKKMLNIAFYAFNPLVIIESLVSAHNDVVMIFFALLGFYLLLKKRFIPALLPWLFSIGIKIGTVFLLPLFGLGVWEKIRVKKVDYQKLIISAILAMSLGVFFVSYRLGYQPWYLLWILPFVALKAEDKYCFCLITGLSLGLLLGYSPFLYYGHWNPPVPIIKLWLTGGGLIFGFLLLFLKKMNILPQDLLTIPKTPVLH